MARRCLSLYAACALAALAGTALAQSPYAGQESRAIKALSAEEIADLQSGRGMGLAKPAELNGYPGPAHVLDLAVPLALTPEQVRIITAIRNRMTETAKPIGSSILVGEEEMERQFASGAMTQSRLETETARLGALQGQLRAAHLSAHIETKAALTSQQVARYNELRGYGAPLTVPAPHRHAE